MTWNWQREDWPHFEYKGKQEEIETLEEKFLMRSGVVVGALKHIDVDNKIQLRIELLSDEAVKTAKIEGELLDRDSVQSSIRKHFGLKDKVNRKVPVAEQAMAQMMIDVYEGFHEALTKEKLCQWHEMLMRERQDVEEVGVYRTVDEAMQVVSGPDYKRKVHYEAPPVAKVPYEMLAFITWFNKTAPGQELALPPLTRAALAHWYFVCIHPFEDGNGRIARALSEYVLAQSLEAPTLISLAYTIEKARKAYYTTLEQHNRSNEISGWVVYFAKTVIAAQENTQKRIEFMISKAKLFDRFSGQLNARQEKVLLRMFREGIDGFTGGLSAENYVSITGTSTATTSRDLKDLVDKGVLIKQGELRYTRYFLNI